MKTVTVVGKRSTWLRPSVIVSLIILIVCMWCIVGRHKQTSLRPRIGESTGDITARLGPGLIREGNPDVTASVTYAWGEMIGNVYYHYDVVCHHGVVIEVKVTVR